MLIWIINRRAGTSRPPRRTPLIRRRDGQIPKDRALLFVQRRQSLRQIISVNLLVWRILELHLPALWWRRWWRNEKELSGVREIEVFVARLDIGVCAEVYFDYIAHDRFAVEDLLDADCGILVVEGDDNAREGFERRPGVDSGRAVDKVLDCDEVLGTEDIFGSEVGDNESV